MEEKNGCHLKRDEKGRLVKGTPPGPGRPQGSVGYETMMNEAIKEYAKLNRIPESEIRKKLYMVGIAGALNKDFQFYKDFMDRTHGKPVQPTDITSAGEVIKFERKDYDAQTEKEMQEFIEWKKNKIINDDN